MVQGNLELNYVGLIFGDSKSKERVHQNTAAELERFVMISFGVDDPEKLASDCFDRIEELAYGSSD